MCGLELICHINSSHCKQIGKIGLSVSPSALEDWPKHLYVKLYFNLCILISRNLAPLRGTSYGRGVFTPKKDNPPNKLRISNCRLSEILENVWYYVSKSADCLYKSEVWRRWGSGKINFPNCKGYIDLNRTRLKFSWFRNWIEFVTQVFIPSTRPPQFPPNVLV